MREEIIQLIKSLLKDRQLVFLNEKEEVFTEENYAKNAGIPYRYIRSEQEIEVSTTEAGTHVEAEPSAPTAEVTATDQNSVEAEQPATPAVKGTTKPKKQ